MKSLLLTGMSVSGRALIQTEDVQDLGREAENKASAAVRAGKVEVLSAEDHRAMYSPGTEKQTKFQEWPRSLALLA